MSSWWKQLPRLLGGATSTTPAPPLRLRQIEAASGRRTGLFPRFGTFAAETTASHAVVRQRARHATTNNAHAASAVRGLVAAIVGSGIRPTSQHADPGTREKLQGNFEAWAGECDADGATDFWGLQAAVCAGVITDGECFVHLLATDDGLRLRLLPAELVASEVTSELGGGARIISGIEFDSHQRRRAYHIRPEPGPFGSESSAPPIRVAAEDILHIRRPLGAGQIRGLSWLAPVLLTLAELDQLTDATLVSAKVAAMHSGFIKETLPGNVNGEAVALDGEMRDGALETCLEPGTVRRLPPGTEIVFSSPAQSLAAMDLARHYLRTIASGIGLPEHRLTGDLSAASYSSLRAGLLAFQAFTEQQQFHWLIPQLIVPVWRRFVTLESLSGEVVSDDLRELFKVECIPPATSSIDPAKDLAAVGEMLDRGLISRRQAVAANGYSVEALDREIAADRAREKRLDLSFGAQPPAAPAAPVPPPAAEEEV